MPSSQGRLRIIGGKWRSRKIQFPSSSKLRPTGERIRETLFNWLSAYVVGSNCLDLFAGSGALGFEALSRGAAHITFVDHSLRIISALKKNAELLKTTATEFVHGECPTRLPRLSYMPFDIVFLDPPFHQGLVEKAAQWLEAHHILSEKAFIYVETEKELAQVLVPDHWKAYREKYTGGVTYYLFLRDRKCSKA